MKKYKVSLAVNVPSNFECRVKARNEREAYHKAVEAFDNGDYLLVDGEIVDAEGDCELEISPDNGKEIPLGVWIKEIKKS